MLFRLLAGLLLAAAWTQVGGAATLRDGRGGVAIGKEVLWLADPTGALSAEEVRALPDTAFRKGESDHLNLGISSATQWLRIVTRSEARTTTKWLLEVENAFLDLAFYTPSGEGLSEAIVSTHLPFRERAIPHHSMLFAFEQAPGETKVHHLRARARVLDLPLRIWSAEGFFEQDSERQFANGILYGVFGVMVLYNLFIFLFVRDRSYLFYVAYIGGFGLYSASAAGLCFRYLWPNAPWWHDKGLNAITCLTIGSLLYFVHLLVDLKEMAPRLARVTQGLALLAAAGALLVFWPEYLVSTYFTNYVALVGLLASIAIAVYASIRRSRPGRLYLVALGGIVFGVLPYVLQNMALIEATFWTTHGAKFGTMFHVTMLSLSLADRINTMRLEKDGMTRVAFESQRKLAARLAAILDATRAMGSAKTEADATGLAVTTVATTLRKDDVPPRRVWHKAPAEPARPDELLFPVHGKAKTHGWLALDAAEGGEPSGDDASFIGALASSLGISLDNVEHLQQVVAKAKLDAALQAAEALQKSLLPQGLTVPGLELRAGYRAAEQTGGDWFGYHHDEASRRLELYLGDVTGHGIPSAIITGVACGAVYAAETTLRAAAPAMSAAERITHLAAAVNRVLYERGEDRLLMSMLFLSLDLATGELVYLNAGHPSGLVAAADGSVQALTSSADPLGYEAAPRYSCRTLRLTPGATVLLYTDGLVENAGAGGATLRTRKLRALLGEASTAGDLHRAIWDEGRAIWKEAPAEDDVTTLVFRWLGEEWSLDAQPRAS